MTFIYLLKCKSANLISWASPRNTDLNALPDNLRSSAMEFAGLFAGLAT